MRDAPCVTSQHTFYKTYYKLPLSMFTFSLKRQPVVIYNINAMYTIKMNKFGEISNHMINIIFSAKFTLTPLGVTLVNLRGREHKRPRDFLAYV